jgi:uncharacterized protein with PIN domain/sulfur carrier protein ThiS
MIAGIRVHSVRRGAWEDVGVSGESVTVRVAAPLRFLLPVRHRDGDAVVPVDPDATVGHLVESLGVPHTEFGALLVNGRPVPPSARLSPGDVVEVPEAPRPQPVAYQRFLLDVHLGALARRMRLLGLDTAYRNDADDDELAAQAVAEGRVLLTRDRGLLRRRAVVAGGYVRGSRADQQLADVLERFAPELRPWTRCPTCNGDLEPVDKHDVEHLLEPGTRRSYTQFSRCRACDRLYWRGAHANRLKSIVDTATR